MTLPKNRLAYDDVYKKFELALEDPKGIRIPFKSYSEAKYYMMRMHMARQVEREENTKIYEPGDDMYGQCAYDIFQCSLREGEDGTWFVYVEPRGKDSGEIERLSEVENDE